MEENNNSEMTKIKKKPENKKDGHRKEDKNKSNKSEKQVESTERKEKKKKTELNDKESESKNKLKKKSKVSDDIAKTNELSNKSLTQKSKEESKSKTKHTAKDSKHSKNKESEEKDGKSKNEKPKKQSKALINTVEENKENTIEKVEIETIKLNEPIETNKLKIIKNSKELNDGEKLLRIKQEVSDKLLEYENKVSSILNIVDTKKPFDVKGYIDNFNREINSHKKQEDLENKLLEMEKMRVQNQRRQKQNLLTSFDKDKDASMFIESAYDNMNKSYAKRLTSTKDNFSHNNQITNLSVHKVKDRNIKETDGKFLLITNRDQSAKTDKSNRKRRLNTENNNDNNDILNKSNLLNISQKDFIESLDEHQLKNFINKIEVNQSVTKYIIDDHVKKIEKYRSELKLKKNIERLQLQDKFKEYKVHNRKSMRSLDKKKLLIEILESYSKEKTLKLQEERKNISNNNIQSNYDANEACFAHEKELEVKKLKSLNVKMQKEKAGMIFKEMIPIIPNQKKQEELKSRLKVLHSPKTKIEQLKIEALSNKEIKFNKETGKLILPDYLDQYAEMAIDKTYRNKIITEKRRKKLEPITYSPTTMTYKGTKPGKSIPKKSLDKYPDYIKDKRNYNQLYLKNESNMKKWNNIISSNKGNLHQNITNLRSSLNNIEKKIERNKILLHYDNNKNKRITQDQGNLLVDSINAKLALLNSIPVD